MDKENKPTHEQTNGQDDNKLVEAVIAEIRHCIAMGDVTPLDRLLRRVQRDDLIGFLPEEQGKKYL